jgi:hypothetical protein
MPIKLKESKDTSPELKNSARFALVALMKFILVILTALSLPATGLAQSGLSADLFAPAPSVDDLFTTRSPEIVKGRFSASLGSNWAYHLLGIENPDKTSTNWIVEQRAGLHAAINYAPCSHFRLAAGFNSAVFQQGNRTNDWGAEVPLDAAMGPTWLSAVWAPLKSNSGHLAGALETSLVFPSPQPSGLVGERDLGVRVTGLFSTRFDWISVLVNLGLATRSQIEFRNLTRDDGLIYRLGVEFGHKSWPVFVSAELAGETPLHNPFSGGLNEFLETLWGVRAKFGDFRLQLGASIGLLGAGAPTVRGLLLVRWTITSEKMGACIE